MGGSVCGLVQPPIPQQRDLALRLLRGSSSSHPTSDTVGMPWRSAVTGLSSKSRHAKGIHAADHDQSGAGVNRNWCESIRQQPKLNSSQLRCRCLPEQQQGRHLFWQSPLLGHGAKTQIEYPLITGPQSPAPGISATRKMNGMYTLP
jgi:hypothetical protein